MSLENLQLNNKFERKEKLKQLYHNNEYTSLYRYDTPNTEYDERRENVVSKKEIIGNWFTDNIQDLKDYIKTRSTNGSIITIRIPLADLKKYDALILENTKDMDIEKGNYIVPREIQADSYIKIPLKIETQNPNKFLFKDWQKINDFVDNNISSPEKILNFVE